MKPLRVLVADDHGIVRRGIRALLETHQGWEVCGEAANGEEAVVEAKRLKPDVAILDISMPRLSGFDATRRIVDAVPGTKILILSMHESEQAVCEVLDAGARGYVFKSDLDRDLLLAVELLSQNKFFFAPRVSEMLVSDCLTSSALATKAKISGGALTARQRQVTRLLAEGKTNKEAAAALNISVKTAETHRTNIMRKLQLQSFSELVRYAVRQKLIEL